MGKKKKMKALKALSANLPLINVQTHEEHWYTGDEILEWGTVKEIGGKPIDPVKRYLYRYPVLMIQNNQRKMKRAYLRNGVEGVSQLYKNTLNIVKSNLQTR